MTLSQEILVLDFGDEKQSDFLKSDFTSADFTKGSLSILTLKTCSFFTYYDVRSKRKSV